MQSEEQKFLGRCISFDDAEKRDYRGSILFKAYESIKHNEDILATIITPKSKFDCLNGIILTKTRVLDINSYSTMYIINSKKYKAIKKIVFEQAFDDREVERLLSDDARPERVQLKVQMLYENNECEELVWENIEQQDSIQELVCFAKRLCQLQTESV